MTATALILGWSAIARRRVIPALAAAGVTSVDVASRSSAARVQWPAGLSGRAFGDYREALQESEARIVYVSTTNDRHADLAAAALESGRHVVVDKPAVLEPAHANSLAALAACSRLLVAEATVYAWHPQIAAISSIFEELGTRPAHLVAEFSFPRLPPDNFRHKAALGGGALLDLGPYAVSAGRLFFGEPPLEIVGRSFTRSGDEVDSWFSVLATYPGGRSLAGHFGTTTGYVNRLEALGPDSTVALERAFTTSPDQVAELRVNRAGERATLAAGPADSYELFLRAVLAAIESGNTAPFASAMLADALALDRLRQSCSTREAR